MYLVEKGFTNVSYGATITELNACGPTPRYGEPFELHADIITMP